MRTSLLALSGLGALAVGVGLWLRHATADPSRGLRRDDGVVDHTVDCDPCGTMGWSGTWFFPRGGPYKVGLEVVGGAGTLEIDGRPVASVPGPRPLERIIYPAGAHAVRVRHEGAGALRLFWL